MSRRGVEVEMRCPKCRRYSLKGSQGNVLCGFCGYQLSPGQAANFRLFRLLKDEKEEHYRIRKGKSPNEIGR